MKDVIKHCDYEKISDDLIIIGYNVVVRMNVTLSKKLQDGTRYGYHHEYKYSTNKYINQSQLITMRRSFDSFVTIENMFPNQNGIKEYIMIRDRDMLYLRHQLNNVYNWFNTIYTSNDKGELIILGKHDPIQIVELAMGKFLKFEPIIITYENNVRIRGVRMYLSCNDNFVDITADVFMGFLYQMESLNMHLSAQSMINYLQRPEQLGEYVQVFDSSPFQYDNNVDPEKLEPLNKTNRKIGDEKSKSAFSKIDGL